jgi:hypothetical protein
MQQRKDSIDIIFVKNAKTFIIMLQIVLLSLLVCINAIADDSDAEWTLLIYNAIDCPECTMIVSDKNVAGNTLEDSLEAEISGMMEATEATGTGNNGVNIVLLVDKFSEEGTRIYEIEDGLMTEIASRPEENTSDPAVLEAFLDFGRSEYPAKKTALIIKSQGLSWRGIGQDTNADGEKELMSIDEIAGALTDKGVDLLIFNGNNMAAIEVAYELRKAVPYMVGTQSQIQEDGLAYGMFIQKLVNDPQISELVFAKSIVDDHLAYYAPKGNIGDPKADTSQNFATMSVYDLSAMDALVAAHTTFATILSGYFPDDLYNVVPHARDESMVGHFNDIDSWDFLSDIYQFMSSLETLLDEKRGPGTYPDLREAMAVYKEVYDNQILVYEDHPDKYHNAHGMSIWYPGCKETYYVRDRDAIDLLFGQTFFYEDPQLALDFVIDSSWIGYLRTYYFSVGGNGVPTVDDIPRGPGGPMPQPGREQES